MPEIIFNGSAGRIEGRYHHADQKAPLALVLHPHPQHGGNMNNKVVYAMFRSFVELGFNVLRFNFRGVGRSEGVYDNGDGELSDAAAAADWLQSQHPKSEFAFISGFSFGSWIAMQLLMRRPEIADFIAVSPPAGRYDFNFLAPCPVSGLIIQGLKDTIVDPAAVDKLVSRLNQQKGINIDYRKIKEADHFFGNCMREFCAQLENYISNKFPNKFYSLANSA